MNYLEHFDKVKSFLEKHHYIYDLEVLKRYPDPIDPYYLKLSENLDGLSNKELASFESDMCESKSFNHELNSLLTEAKELIAIPKEAYTETELGLNLNRKLNPKKKHELSTLKTYFDKSKFTKVFDIGGGVGHLSNVFVANTNKAATCFDMNIDFINSGKKKINRWLVDHKDKVSFINQKVDNTLDIDLSKTSLIAGLHSCGELSVDIIKLFASKNEGGLLNFGCCYHQLGEVYNISNHSKSNPLEITNNALHLATRSYAYTNEIDVEQRRKVKLYRYAIHHLGMKYFNDEFITLGNGKKEDYNSCFSDYVLKYYDKAKELTKYQIEDFYNLECTQQKIHENFYLDFIRALFGRVIEVYLLLDRVIYLKEHKVDARLVQIFKRELSPRNIAIIS